MTVPNVNQIFLGGYFNGEITIGDFSMTNPEINNVYLTYLKDDTWLRSEESPESIHVSVYPNPFSNSFTISDISDMEQIRIYNNMGRLIEVFSDISPGFSIGKEWKSGVYTIQVERINGEFFYTKVIKIGSYYQP